MAVAFDDGDLETAALERDGSSAGEGDVALAALLSVHTIAINAGLLHSIEHHGDEELARGIDGHRYFDLADASPVVAWVGDQAATLDLDVEAAELLELEANRRYGELVPDDSAMTHRSAAHFARRPDRYAQR